MDVLVLGAGVIGLTTAVHLAESGMRVEVRSAVPPDRTTSAAAGAMWGLYLVDRDEQVLRWGRDTRADFLRLAAEPASGVRLVDGVEASRRGAMAPEWATLVPGARPCEPAELPAGFASGIQYRAPVLDMPVYLDYLLGRLRAAGGRLRIQWVPSLAAAADDAPVVVNCTGIRAGEMAGDEDVYPIRGQVVVALNPGLTDFFAEDTDDQAELLYILPQGDKVVLGGTAETGSWALEPDPVTARGIVERCAAVAPSLATAPVLAHRVGLRPGRVRIRLEEQRNRAGCRLIHSYGHGGAGVSLSWGCAREIRTRLAEPPGVGDLRGEVASRVP